jgi:hypothetical protein
MKNGDKLPCGGKVTFVSSTGYYFTPAGGGSRQWVGNQTVPDVVIDYVALHAAQASEERERNRERTPDEDAAMAAEIEAARLARLAQPDDIARAEVMSSNVPAEHRDAWIAGVVALGSRPPMHHIESVRVCGMSLKNGYWVKNAVQSYDGGGSGYGRHAD